MTYVPLTPPPIPAPPAAVAFTGDRGEFRRLVTRGALLELVTIGFYRFWLATDMRRHLWSHTEVDGDGAEYTGRGKELLIGFLIAMAILVPVYLAYFIVGLEAEQIRSFASLPLVAFLYVFGQFAIYRARRYRLTRTVWRGVRFWMSGSGWGYAARAAGWGMLMSLTLGLILPWRDAALERYKMRHSYYGDLQGSFDGRGSEFFKRGWWLWLLVPFCFVVPPLAPFVYAAFKAVQWRWWLSGIRFGGVRLQSTLRRGELIGLYWKAIGWSVLLFAGFLAYEWFSLLLLSSMSGASIQDYLRQFAQSRDVLAGVPLMVLSGGGYLALALALNVVLRVYLMRDLWARVVVTTSIHGVEALANVAAKGELANALGEGFADGLDVAGF
jgi:uncharacterized membrane protein YjgN (DUF898 family)